MNFSQMALQNAAAAAADSALIINSETGDDTAPSAALKAARKARSAAEFNRALRALPGETKTSQGAIVRYDRQYNGQELSKSTVSRMMNGGDKLVGTRPEQIRSFVTACGVSHEAAVWVKLWQMFRDGKVPLTAVRRAPSTEQLLRSFAADLSGMTHVWAALSALLFGALLYREARQEDKPKAQALGQSALEATAFSGGLWVCVQTALLLLVRVGSKMVKASNKTPSKELRALLESALPAQENPQHR